MSSFADSFSRLRKKAERSWAIVPVMASVCIVTTGNALLTTSVSLKLSDPQIASSVVQFVLTAFPVGFLTGCILAKSVVVRLGHERTFLLVALLSAIVASGFMLTTLVPVWILLRLLSGLSLAMIFVVCESWINLYADERNRGTYFSLYMMTSVLAVLLGQVLVALVGAESPYLFAVAAGTIYLGVFFCRFLGGRWPALPAWPQTAEIVGVLPIEKGFGLWRLAVLVPVTIVGVFQAGMTNTNVFAMTPIYGVHVGLTASATVGLLSAFSIGGLLAQAPVGLLSDRFDRRIMLLVQGALAALLCAAIVWAGNRHPALLVVLFFAYGATTLTIYPVAIAFANSQIDGRYMVAASGGLLLLYSFGNVMTPGVAAGLMTHVAPQALFVLLGSGAALVAAAACFNLVRRPAKKTECLVLGASE